MNTKQLQLVTYEQAKRLKGLGFDWELTKAYNFDKRLFSTAKPYNHNSGTDEYRDYSAPTVALALKWTRDEKGITCGIERYASYKHTRGWWIDNRNIEHYADVFAVYEAAESALLDKLLDILEKEKEQ
jgi:hypothetical protein